MVGIVKSTPPIGADERHGAALHGDVVPGSPGFLQSSFRSVHRHQHELVLAEGQSESQASAGRDGDPKC